jgi:beta-galactosidase
MMPRLGSCQAQSHPHAALLGVFLLAAAGVIGCSSSSGTAPQGTGGTPDAAASSGGSAGGGSAGNGGNTGAAAGKVVLTADHGAITTDLDDVAYVRAAVPTATAPVTFSVSGPGTILAVDSGSQAQETFRGDTRSAFGNLAFAIVRATGPGTITVTAKSAGLSDGTATIEASAGPFIPCSGTCD